MPRFQSALKAMAVASLHDEFPIRYEEPDADVDWKYMLTCASALTAAEDEAAQDAVLRIAQSCLRTKESGLAERAAAALLLERVGNQPAVELAVDRGLLSRPDYLELSPLLAIDGLLRRQELTLDVPGRGSMSVNPFQKTFWNLVGTHQWVSISAPTSAGKSRIVREWMLSEMLQLQRAKFVYLAPTRALVEEVSDAFRSAVSDQVSVHTLPWDPGIGATDRQVYVLTQERLHLLQHRLPDFRPEVIFVDEAQKIGDGTRGILLSQVLDEAVQRDPSVRLVFASPLSDNPGILVDSNGAADRTVASIVGESVTVNQNLVYVNQARRRPKSYELELVRHADTIQVGEIELERAPDGVGQKVPMIAVGLAGTSGGNLLYANGAAEAEKFARIVYELLGPDGDLDSEELKELAAYSRGVVHDRFSLAEYARRGVAFHYGDMPLVLKAKVEDLFRSGHVRYLVCTSTLLEGVNLPCRNIFIRAPKKGRTTFMSMADFWNLAGRAGRWGKEFQGNIFCIDTRDERAWPEKPQTRKRSSIRPAAQIVVAEQSQELLRFMDGAEASPADRSSLESTLNWLTSRFLEHQSVGSLLGVRMSPSQLADLEGGLREVVDQLELDPGLIKRHAGISPIGMQSLYQAARAHGHPGDLALVPPTSDDAHAEYKQLSTG